MLITGVDGAIDEFDTVACCANRTVVKNI